MDTASVSTVPQLDSPGKDSARLLQDIIEHTFHDENLYSPPPAFDPTRPHMLQPSSHSHSWVMKTRRTTEQRPWNVHFGDQSVTAVCETCRMHLVAQGIIVADGPTKCGTPGGFSSHHFHPEKWLGNPTSRQSSPPGSNTEVLTFKCCQCAFQLSAEFGNPVVPEYLLFTLKRRRTNSSTTNSSASSSSIDRSDPKAFAAAAFRTLYTYCMDVLNSAGGGTPTRNILYRSDSPFAKRVGLNSDVMNFMKHLGWQPHDDVESFEPPAWDEETSDGRVKRKLLEAAEIELAVLALQYAKESDKGNVLSSIRLGFMGSDLDFQPDITRAEDDLATLMAAEPWPRYCMSFRVSTDF
jgi:hypothetical protein